MGKLFAAKPLRKKFHDGGGFSQIFIMQWLTLALNFMIWPSRKIGSYQKNGMDIHGTLMRPCLYLQNILAQKTFVLKFRDDVFHTYFGSPVYLKMIDEKFGKKVKEHIQEMAKTKLKRKLIENQF